MKASTILESQAKPWSLKKKIVVTVLIILFLAFIGWLQNGTDDKPETQKRGSVTGASLFF